MYKSSKSEQETFFAYSTLTRQVMAKEVEEKGQQ